jgi:hypothetical protein
LLRDVSALPGENVDRVADEHVDQFHAGAPPSDATRAPMSSMPAAWFVPQNADADAGMMLPGVIAGDKRLSVETDANHLLGVAGQGPASPPTGDLDAGVASNTAHD